jgi:hypothetical protein
MNIEKDNRNSPDPADSAGPTEELDEWVPKREGLRRMAIPPSTWADWQKGPRKKANLPKTFSVNNSRAKFFLKKELDAFIRSRGA